MRFARILGVIVICLLVSLWGLTLHERLATVTAGQSVPGYKHIFLVVEENHGFEQIIGNPQAPNINQFAKQFGLATHYFSVADPSAPNYVAMLGGNFFGIADDNPYFTHTVNQPSLIDQLEGAGLSWKGYFQGMPFPGYMSTCYPTRCNGMPDTDPLYSSKHNGLPYFANFQKSKEQQMKMVPSTQLDLDLQNNQVPNFNYIIPDQCHDMHGSPPYCLDGGNPGTVTDNVLVNTGDAYVGQLVKEITGSKVWSDGNDAIVITWDEGNGTQGCCDANPGTGRVSTLVITNHGPRGLQDPHPYNHYSLLQTIQMAFGLGCLQFTCDTANVTPMAPLFAVS